MIPFPGLEKIRQYDGRRMVWHYRTKQTWNFDTFEEALAFALKNGRTDGADKFTLRLLTDDSCTNCGGGWDGNGDCANYCDNVEVLQEV